MSQLITDKEGSKQGRNKESPKHSPKNMQNYTFGGSKNIQGSNLESMLKGNMPIKDKEKEERQFKFSQSLTRGPSSRAVSAYNKRFSNHPSPTRARSQISAEQRYVEAKNEIPRFNEELDVKSGKAL